jgi:hypothetical protein
MAAAVEPGIMSFLNHGCNGTYNTGMLLTETELTVELGRGPAGIVSYDIPAYHPRMTRHFPSTPDDVNVALRDIPAGSELLDNYLVFGGVDNVEYWDENLVDLKNMCSGRSGSITQYEKAAVVNHSTAPLR